MESDIKSKFHELVAQTLSAKDMGDYVIFYNNHGDRMLEAKDRTFHMLFNKSTGFTMKWGKTVEDNPLYCPFGPELADIEITKMCRGIRDKNGRRTPCGHCYKSNSANGLYMSFELFKQIFDKIVESKTLTQIAFGVDAEASDVLNPDIWKIFDYCIQNDVTPNVTVADIDEYTAKNLVRRCGAIAVSYYGLVDKNRCYDSVKLLLEEAAKIHKDMKINIHCLLSSETYDSVFELLDDRLKDPRLQGMGAIVFLSLKQKGRGVYFNKLPYEKFKTIIERCLKEEVSFGMDSCSANKFIKSLDDLVDEDKKKSLMSFVEPCESFGIASMYVNCQGIYFPCSFMEKEGKWKEGIDLTKINNFVKDVWYSTKLCEDREHVLAKAKCNGGCTSCPYYDI